MIWFVRLIPMGSQVCLWIWWQLEQWCHGNYWYLLTPLWFCTSSSTHLWQSFNSLSLHPKQHELQSISGRKQENLLASVHDRFFFFGVLKALQNAFCLTGLLQGEGMSVNRKLFARAHKRGVSESASSWHCSLCAKWITSPVTPNYHLRWFCKWFSLLAMPFGQPFLGL